MINILKKRLNKKGMTLIEVVVSFAIVTVILSAVLIGFRTMGSVLQDSGIRNDLNQQLEQQIAQSEQTDDAVNLTLTPESGLFTIDGSIWTYSMDVNEDERTQSFRVFTTETVPE